MDRAGADSVDRKRPGLIAVNLCEKAVAFTIRSSEFIWTAADIEAFYAKASPQLRFALLVALWAVSGKATC